MDCHHPGQWAADVDLSLEKTIGNHGNPPVFTGHDLQMAGCSILLEGNLCGPARCFFCGASSQESFVCSRWGLKNEGFVLCGAPKIAKLANISPISLWFVVLKTIVFMGFINQQTYLGAPHCRVHCPLGIHVN